MRAQRAILMVAGLSLLILSPTRIAAQKPQAVELENDRVRVRFTPDSDGVRQEYFARHDDQWVLIAEAFRPPTPFPSKADVNLQHGD